MNLKIINRLHFFIARGKPEKKNKYEEQDMQGRHLIKKDKPKKLYDYYICDYCGAEIPIKVKWEDKTGGITKIPQTMSNMNQVINLALCSKCLNPVLKEFEYKDKNKYIGDL